MKSLCKTIFACLAICLATLQIACDKEGPTAQETQLKKLESKLWSVNSVIVDGADRTSLFQGMTLRFSGKTFSATSGGHVWPASGSWEFTDAAATTILRNDNVTVTIEQISESQLELSLFWSETTFGPGRTKSISGTHVFNLR